MTRVDFITLSRSDYASLRPVALAAARDPDIRVKVIAGGSHLLERFGKSIDAIAAEGFPELETVAFLNEQDSSDAETAAAYARAVDGFVRALGRSNPDFVFVVGDRWEMLAPVTAASLLRIPVAHHSGGDITQGSADNQTRYALTALAHVHFTALEEHAERLLRMGEESWRVRVTGEPALTGLTDLAGNPQAGSELRSFLGLKPDEPFVLATFHPTSYDALPPEAQIRVFMQALDLIEDQIVLTAPNPDPGSGAFLDLLSGYAVRSRGRVRLFSGLGRDRYYAAMAEARFMIGNSSSGLWEAPSLALPVVNIGRRQQGRVRGKNVLDAGLDANAICAAILEAGSARFRESLQGRENPYLKADTVEWILAGLKEKRSRAELLAKMFVDPLKAPPPRGGK
jgi:UDP-hydrolysing UDP-N-acetyl-D-glucosamine 2-epimerase